MASSNPPVGARGTLDLLSAGVNVTSIDKSTGNSWAQNVLYKDGAYQVRPGYGTLARYSTTLNAGRNTSSGQADPTPVAGYTSLLAATAITTNQGHEQVLAVLGVRCYSSDYQEDSSGAWADPLGQFLTSVVLSVYDVTTDRRQEYLFLNKTADLVSDNDLSLTQVKPHFQTCRSLDRQSALRATPTSASFVHLNDVTYIVIPDVGVWYYRPVDPVDVNTEGVHQAVQTVNTSHWQSHGEPSALSHMIPANGPFTESYTYFSPSTFPAPTCGAAMGNRIVWAKDRTLYFSDPDAPNHIIANNVYVIPSELPITALQATQDRLVIFTESQVYLYQPSMQDALQSGGRLVEVSVGLGALSQNHTTKFLDSVCFVSQSGVHLITGTEAKDLSEPIASWFQNARQIQNPLSSYKVAAGITTLATAQPRARIDLQSQLRTCNLRWHDFTGTLYVTFDDVTLTWRPNVGWAVHLYETAAIGTTVGVKQNILHPQVCPSTTRLFLVSGPHATAYVDVTDNHYLILESGRGQSLDVTSSTQEDRRNPTGNWTQSIILSGTCDFYLGRPIKMPLGWKTAYQTTNQDIYLVPLYISALGDIRQYTFRVNFDNTNWQFLFNPAGDPSEVDYVLPNNRITSDNYNRLGMDATHRVMVYDNTGVPSIVGDELRIDWTGVGGTWNMAPSMNNQYGDPSVIIYLPMRRLTNTTVLNMGWSATVASASIAGAPQTGYVYHWDESKSYPQQTLANDALAQPIDWAVKSRQVNADGNQVKMRGVFTRSLSYGQATERAPASWLLGPLNSVTTADYKDYSGQRTDWLSTPAGISEIDKVDSIRARLKPLNLTQPLSLKTGANIAKWGSTSDPSKGNLLIDDPAVDTIATSEGVRGEHFSTMLFGSLCHPGEHVELQSAQGLYVVTGARRRGGR